MRNPTRRYLPAIRSPIQVAYWAAAIVCGVIVGYQVIPFPVDIPILLGIGLGAIIVRRRVEGRNDPQTSWLWTLLFALVWLPIAFARHAFPFSG